MTLGQRVFITGRSALTSCGHTADETWDAVLAGNSGIGEISLYDLSSWTHRLGGELKQFQPAKMLPDRKLLKVISRQDVMGINVAMQAVEQSQLISFRDSLNERDEFNEKTAVYVGSPGNKYVQQYDFLPLLAKTKGEMPLFAEQLFSEVHPMWLLKILPNNVLAYTGISYGFKGANQNISNHAVGGTQALLEAYHAIKNGQAERAVVVAYDSAIEPQALFYYEKLGVISPRHLKPFATDHDGTILAEGAAALILESEASVKARSAHCYAEIIGGKSSSEMSGLFSLNEMGTELADLLTDILNDQQLDVRDIDFIVAHGNGNQKSDISEAHAIQTIFGDRRVPVSAFKWAMGHTICASGLIDAVLTTYALEEKCIPGIANLDHVALDCQTLDVSREKRGLSKNQAYALLISRGYASMNAGLVIKSCEN